MFRNIRRMAIAGALVPAIAFGFSTNEIAALEKAVTSPILPYAGEAASSATFAALEIDAADVAADESWGALANRAEYDVHRLELRRKMLSAMGDFPKRTPLNARTVARYRREGYAIEKVIFESMPGVHVTGNLFIPDGTGRRPAVVMSCGHSDEGKDCDIYLRACVIAVRAGLVAFMFDPYQQGDRRTATRMSSCTFHNQMGLRGSLIDWSAPLLRVWDGMRAIDYVLSRPEVEARRLGYMGQSGGGTMTALMEAADDRIRAAAPSCYLTSLRALCQTMGPQDGEQNIYGQLAFGLNHTGYVLIPDIPVAVTCKTSDMFPFYGTRTLFRTVQGVERKLGLGQRAMLNQAPGYHGWAESTESASVKYLVRHLAGREVLSEANESPLLDIGFSLESADLGLKRSERGCAPKGRTSNLPGERHIFEVIAERSRTLLRGAAALSVAEKRRQAASRAKVVLPAANCRKVKVAGEKTVAGCKVLQFAFWHPRRGDTLAAVLLTPSRAAGSPVLIAAAEGRSRGLELALPLLQAGRPVMIADVSGVGELGKEMFFFYGESGRPDEGLGAMCYLLGEPLVGRRASDLLLLAETLAGRCGGVRPELHASGPLAIAAAHAVAADGKAFARVNLHEPPAAWREVLLAGAKSEARLYYADVVPRAFLYYDWPELLTGNL